MKGWTCKRWRQYSGIPRLIHWISSRMWPLSRRCLRAVSVSSASTTSMPISSTATNRRRAQYSMRYWRSTLQAKHLMSAIQSYSKYRPYQIGASLWNWCKSLVEERRCATPLKSYRHYSTALERNTFQIAEMGVQMHELYVTPVGADLSRPSPIYRPAGTADKSAMGAINRPLQPFHQCLI